MNKLTQAKTTMTPRILGATVVLASALSFPATANPDERYENYEPRHPHHDGTYEEARPFRVYVNIRSIERNNRNRATNPDVRRIPRDRRNERRGAGRTEHQAGWQNGADLYRSITMHKIERELPSNILLVDSPTYADMVVKVRETGFDLNFRVTDMDQKNKKYKKDRKFTGGRCGIHHKAFYTRVEEKGEANAFYSVKYDVKGIGTKRDDFRLKASEKFRYGQNLTASTNCGVRATHNLPSNGVAKLFNQAHPSYRHHVASEIRSEAAEELGKKLARKIRNGADNYYANLGERYQHSEYHENSHRYSEHKLSVGALIASIILN